MLCCETRPVALLRRTALHSRSDATRRSIDPTLWGMKKDRAEIDNLPDHLYTMHRSACAGAGCHPSLTFRRPAFEALHPKHQAGAVSVLVHSQLRSSISGQRHVKRLECYVEDGVCQCTCNSVSSSPGHIGAGAMKSVADMYPELNVVLGEHLTYGEFAQLLRRSKIFVSPLG